MSLDQNPVNLELKAPVKVDLKDYELLKTLGAGRRKPTQEVLAESDLQSTRLRALLSQLRP